LYADFTADLHGSSMILLNFEMKDPRKSAEIGGEFSFLHFGRMPTIVVVPQHTAKRNVEGSTSLTHLPSI
jgi:hypothetical protein